MNPSISLVPEQVQFCVMGAGSWAIEQTEALEKNTSSRTLLPHQVPNDCLVVSHGSAETCRCYQCCALDMIDQCALPFCEVSPMPNLSDSAPTHDTAGPVPYNFDACSSSQQDAPHDSYNQINGVTSYPALGLGNLDDLDNWQTFAGAQNPDVAPELPIGQATSLQAQHVSSDSNQSSLSATFLTAQASHGPRGRRSGPLQESSRQSARKTRQDGSVCIRCKTGKIRVR
ncbi:hypothetical protein CDD81_6051 [Ophiocordyceps australis]|uniref:Uncharacterized protein n=1 Tax=Ophiocordyceps australis TaxID=1399860 RepID=A0A2C5Y8S1_9HYPO|nr:hypothetical protein CDD81_6051 [Ophiocordyceps australis]